MRFNIAEEKERKRIYKAAAEQGEFTEEKSKDLTASERLATVAILLLAGFARRCAWQIKQWMRADESHCCGQD
jgi:hypothetical protein